MNPTRNLITAFIAVVVLSGACKKNNAPAPAPPKSQECLLNSFSTGNKSASGYTGNISYSADKTISEVRTVQTGNATIDDRYSYSGNTTTIVSDIVYNNGSKQSTTSTITKNNSGQVVAITFATN